MAEFNGVHLNVDWFGLQTDVVELSDWTNGSGSFQKRSDIIHAIIHNRSMDHLVTIVGSDWDVNQVLNVPNHKKEIKNYHPLFNELVESSPYLKLRWVPRTALHEAVKRGWTEGVKILLDAGATCTTSDLVKHPLVLAIKNQDYSSVLWQLLKHGSQLNVDWFGLQTDVVELSDWTNGSRSFQKRSDIIHAIIHNRSMDHLVTIVGSDWDVNEVLSVPDHKNYFEPYEPWDMNEPDEFYDSGPYLKLRWVPRTALHEAAKRGWSEGVKILLDAGATCTTSDVVKHPLVLAIKNQDYSSVLCQLLKHGSQLNVDWFGLKTDVVELSDWTNGSRSFQKRSDVIHAIIHNRSMDHLVTIVESDWDVNEVLNVPDHEKYFEPYESCYTGPNLEWRWVHRTALGEVTRQGWTEGVKILLDAGAKWRISGDVENPLVSALRNQDCSPDLIQILLQHGADPNEHLSKYIPLLQAIHNARRIGNYNNEKCTKIVLLLLENGADPNVKTTYKYGEKECPLSAVWNKTTFSRSSRTYAERLKTNTTLLLKLLVKFGADVNYELDHKLPLLRAMAEGNERDWKFGRLPMFPQERTTMAEANERDWKFCRWLMFPQELLDLFFSNGGNIQKEYGNRTALEYIISICGHSNWVRWLIRHGADTSPLNVTPLKDHFKPTLYHSLYTDIALILLQAGMRVSHEAHTQLIDMKRAVSTWLQAKSSNDYKILHKVEAMWTGRAKRFPRTKRVFPEYFKHQLVDLQEFSDKSLNVYPENTPISHTRDKQRQWICILDQIHSMLEFLGQPQSLQWYCRRCVRENLASLQPSVVKTLPGPARFKRYILCHEI